MARISATGLGLFILVGAGVANAQVRTVAGRVTNEVTAQPVSDGEVHVVGLEISDRLRPDGVFVLRIPDRAVTVLVSAPGFASVRLRVPAELQVLQVRLVPAVQQVGPVVVSAQATAFADRYADVPVAVVEGDRLRDVPAASLGQALQGKVVGADIQQNSGAPGGPAQLRLRGVASILGNARPLYVVDGVLVNDAPIPSGTSAITKGQEDLSSRIADLNINDIESVEVLRGPAAALYGSRAANGVVIIHTKRGLRRPNP